MRKTILSILLVIILFSTNAYGATSGDMNGYVRQDVLNERDRAFMAEIQLGRERLFHQIREEMDKRFGEIDKRFNNLEKQLEVINERTESTKTMLYWILALLAAIIALPSVQSFLQWREEKKEKQEPFLTPVEIQAVKRLIEINNTSLVGK